MSGPELLGPYTLFQPEGVFPLGEDALALGSFATVKRGWRVCDLGTGSGCLLLLLAGREEELRLSGVDRDPAAPKPSLPPTCVTGARPRDECACGRAVRCEQSLLLLYIIRIWSR